MFEFHLIDKILKITLYNFAQKSVYKANISRMTRALVIDRLKKCVSL